MIHRPPTKAICRQYRHATKVRKQIRKDREEEDHCREQTRQQKKFMADKNAFTKELFNPPNATVPTFDVNIAYEHFNVTNEDKTRNVMLKAMPGWSRPKNAGASSSQISANKTEFRGRGQKLKSEMCSWYEWHYLFGVQEMPWNSEISA